MAEQNCTYVAITNIPSEFRTADLRAHFSTFVENGSFICFHYRHRPEKISKGEKSKALQSKVKSKFCCVVIKILSARFSEFNERYSGGQWTDVSNNYSTHRCHISNIKVVRGFSDSVPKNSEDFIQEEKLLAMPELKPPDLMPNGNVGTPTSIFLDYIQRCLLPNRLVNTLQLKFPKTEGKRLYSNVNYAYEDDKKDTNVRSKLINVKSHLRKSTQSKSQPMELYISHVTEKGEVENKKNIAEPANLSPRVDATKSCHETDVNSAVTEGSGYIPNTPTKRELKKLKKIQQKEMVQLMNENIEEHLINIDRKYRNDEDAEEWDRHEAMENDPSNQERNKERLYEEEIEQPWEKGGPGVVFYTDAMYWQAREGDFDEQTTDDLDVDFSPYEGDGPGDKDIRDFLKIRQEVRFRSGYDKTDRFSIGLSTRPAPDKRPTSFSSLSLPGPSLPRKPTNEMIGQFEIHTRGVGRKILEKQGWMDGQGLGKSQSGIKQALKGEGQRPHKKKGLGFVETEPVCYRPPTAKKAMRSESHIITTSYDTPHDTDPKEKLLERQEPTTLKHRKSFLDNFSPGQ